MAHPGDSLRSVDAIHHQREQTLAAHYGGFYWGADFIGFAVAMFFTLVLLGLVGAIVGTVGYQMGAPVPRIGGSVSGVTENLGIGGLVGSLVALFVAYLLGGYTAGRMARFDGVRNGIGVVLWTIVVAIILGILGAVLGSKYNIGSQLHLSINGSTLTVAGVVSLVVTLVVMLLAAILGGTLGVRYHQRIDRDIVGTT